MITNSPYPSRTEFNNAIANPHHVLKDNELKSGLVKKNQLGPVGVAGNFAIVYQLECNGKIIAVRCFTRHVDNNQRRYSALSQYLSRLNLQSMVDFAYQNEGILVNGQWFPIVRMEWIKGTQLNKFVEDNLNNRQALEGLAKQWPYLINELKREHIAHGDLQHGNILVDEKNNIRLVDYDGIFIPPLQNDPPGEAGHPNYQHHERYPKAYYKENVDAFSSIVIYLSLLALANDPNLWNKFHTGENLIFLAKDFEKYGNTPIWNELRKSRDPIVIRLTDWLEESCNRDISMVPDLETALRDPVNKTPRRPPRTLTSPAKPFDLICSLCSQSYPADEIYCQNDLHILAGEKDCPNGHGLIPKNSKFCPQGGEILPPGW